jgi:hypothetical protein
MIVAAFLTVAVLAGVLALVRAGFRDGDELGDALVLGAAPSARPRGTRTTVSNPGAEPVLVGFTLGRPGIRLRLEIGGYVRVRTARIAPEVMASRQAVVGVVRPGESCTFVVPAGPGLGRRAELVAVIGQAGRLRTIHRMVRLPAPARRRRLIPARAREQARA